MTTPPRSAVLIPEFMSLLHGWLARRLPADATSWLDQQLAIVASGDRSHHLATAVGLAPRRVGKADLDLSEDEQRAGSDLRPGLDAIGWSLDQAARILLVLSSFSRSEDAFAATLNRLFGSAEIGEHIALLRGLPLFPTPERLLPRAAEGVRSAMRPIFEAVAHRNPYPRERFSEAQWNQMVVKALFVGSTLAPIQGLDERRNGDLARMLVDYAHERWAAGRPVSAELWRCVGPFAGEPEIRDLAKVLAEGNGSETAAAALALSECPRPAAREALKAKPDLAAAIGDRCITWNHIT